MNRRGFISLLSGAAGLAALPSWRIRQPVIFLLASPSRTMLSDYFASPYGWHPWTEYPPGVSFYDRRPFNDPFYVNALGPDSVLSEATINRALAELRELAVDKEKMLLRATRRIVSPDEFHRILKNEML